MRFTVSQSRHKSPLLLPNQIFKVACGLTLSVHAQINFSFTLSRMALSTNQDTFHIPSEITIRHRRIILLSKSLQDDPMPTLFVQQPLQASPISHIRSLLV